MDWKPIYLEKQLEIDTLYSLFIESKPKGFEFPGETHDFWECRYILKGKICASGDDKIYELSQGDIIFHKPMELHKYYIDGNETADILIFSFNMNGPLKNYFNDKVFHLTNEQQNILNSLIRYIKETIKDTDKTEKYKKEEQFLQSFYSTPLYIQRVITYLEYLFLSLADKGNISEVSYKKDALLFSRTVNYMNENIYEKLSVSEIAKHCYISESSLKRLFSKYAGMSIHKYFLKLKFNSAFNLLKDGMSVNEVTEKLNFSSQSYFSVSFKREFGINPSKIIQ